MLCQCILILGSELKTEIETGSSGRYILGVLWARKTTENSKIQRKSIASVQRLANEYAFKCDN